MYLNFIQILSIVLLFFGIVTLAIGKFKKKKYILAIGIVFLLAILVIWSTIFIMGLMEENPNSKDNIGKENIVKNNIIENDILENNIEKQAENITEKMLNDEFYFLGTIYDIDENYIYFSNNNYKKYCINKKDFSYLNGRTAKSMNLTDVKVGDYINEDGKKIIVYRKISGDELNKELLYNFTLEEDEKMMMVNTIEIEDIDIIENKAIVKIKYGDVIGDDITDEKFETIVEFNSNTKFYSKGNNINSVNDLEYAKYNINSIILDRDTINKESPAIVNIFESTDN